MSCLYSELYNGFEIPTVFYGTHRVFDELVACMDAAFETGYRGIDTASLYHNERRIGEAIKLLLPKYSLERRNIFVSTKLPPKSYGTSAAMSAFESSLKALNLNYLDLYLVHWPGIQGLRMKHKMRDIRGYMTELRRQSWRVLESLVISDRETAIALESDAVPSETLVTGSGSYRRVRSIGVCNYLPRHLEELAQYATITPTVVQFEYHPYIGEASNENLLRRTCTRLFPMSPVHFQSHSPLAGGDQELLTNAVVTKISGDLMKTTAQLVIRWNLQKGNTKACAGKLQSIRLESEL
ncbi:unnamed protein product [Calicophoron daubneyi]|uniref:NADP-dependent oxidoreductase domain-containing protein n=1 Tax=Calicophoron daubneyi TaxID=300641 RepID=A0AAV2SZ04_CALDB